jgi:protein-S-isoprenylcysteine O-methyltransferase Ste14
VRILDHFERSGAVLFRWRSYIPLVMVPLLIVPLRLDRTHELPLAWELFAGAVAIAGEVLRFIFSGRVPPGTSERSTTSPRAASLSTTGVYSLVRHPLYIANTMTMLGLALFPGRWELPVIVLLLSFLYYERIAVHEEVFLEERFGEEFRRWADRVPALIPSFRTYEPSRQPFSWVRAMEREFNGILAIAASLFLLDLFDDSPSLSSLHVSAVWTVFLLAAALSFLAMVARKHAIRRLQYLGR